MAKGVTMGGGEGGGEFVGGFFCWGWRIFFRRGGGFFGEKNDGIFLKVICLINQDHHPGEKKSATPKKKIRQQIRHPDERQI